MATNLRQEIILEKEKWDEFVDNCPQGTIFHSSLWLNSIVNRNNNIKLYLIGFFKGEELSYGFPVFIMKKNGLNLAFSPAPYTGSSYGGLISTNDGKYKDKYLDVAVKKITDFIFSDLKASYIYIKNSYPIYDFSSFRDYGYEIETEYTYIIDLSITTEKLWKNLKGETRTAIRKANKNDLKLSSNYEKEDIELIHDMLKDTYKRSSLTPPLSKADLISYLDTFSENIKIFFVEKDSIKMACAIIITYKKYLYYWIGASVEKYWEYRPMNFLQWEIIRWGNENGYLKYDLIGANTPEISRFKAGYNPYLVKYYVFKKYNNVVIKYLEKLHLFNRKIHRRISW